MTNKPVENYDGKIDCRICLTEIPQSEAKSAEAHDYIFYFCGLECYDQWMKQESSEEKKE